LASGKNAQAHPQALGSATFTVAGVATGNATVSFTDAAGNSVKLPVGVTLPGAILLSPASLSFLAVGAANARAVNVTQANYSGAFTPSTTTCSGIATIASASGASFSIVPVAAGHCTFSIAGALGKTATLTVDVTTTTVGGS
jgi:hypothetical protein